MGAIATEHERKRLLSSADEADLDLLCSFLKGRDAISKDKGGMLLDFVEKQFE